jgi:hypothetical protein
MSNISLSSYLLSLYKILRLPYQSFLPATLLVTVALISLPSTEALSPYTSNFLFYHLYLRKQTHALTTQIFSKQSKPHEPHHQKMSLPPGSPTLPTNRLALMSSAKTLGHAIEPEHPQPSSATQVPRSICH